jgi:hypothetical protein
LYKSKSRNKYDSGHKLAVTSSRMVQKIALLTQDLLTRRMITYCVERGFVTQYLVSNAYSKIGYLES